MSDWKHLQLTREGRVLTVAFDSGTRVNGLTQSLMRELTRLANELQEDSELSAIILRGTDSMFSGGMDLRDPELADNESLRVEEMRQQVKLGPRMCAAWEALDPVTIVAIEGWCIGGGAALAVSCDWRVMAEDAQFYVPELRLGMNMSWQSVPRFVNLIGPARAKQLLVLARPAPAQQAERWGLADFLAPPGQALARAQELAAEVAAMPPIPVRMTKRSITETATALNRATSFMDADQFLLTYNTEDRQEGMEAFFEKREPDFKGD